MAPDPTPPAEKREHYCRCSHRRGQHWDEGCVAIMVHGGTSWEYCCPCERFTPVLRLAEEVKS